MTATQTLPESEIVQGPYTCNGDPRGCDGEQFGGCLHCDEKRRVAAQDKANLLAGQLRQMAAWLESHPEAASHLMLADVGFSHEPRIVLYKVAPLKQAFPGCAAMKRRCDTSDVYSLEHDGIAFEAWESAQPALPEKVSVTL